MRTTSSREVYRNPWIRVREDVIERDDGSAGLYGVVEQPDFALVIPAERDGFWLVEQFRYPLGRRSWEFPQGTWARRGGTAARPRTWPGPSWPRRPASAPARSATSGHLDLAPGLSTQEFDVWLATGLTAGPTAPGGHRGGHAHGVRRRGGAAGDDRATAGSPTAPRWPPSACSCSTAADDRARSPPGSIG